MSLSARPSTAPLLSRPDLRRRRRKSKGVNLRPIWELILDNMKDVPPEDLAQLPSDGASEMDHYLYSHPKRNQ
jgi:hypothetical protein